MAEYYPLLAKAVASLPTSTPDTRGAIYERARKALLGQLRNIQPPVAEADIQRESQALDVAVARLETEIAAQAAVEAAFNAESFSPPPDVKPAEPKAAVRPPPRPAPPPSAEPPAPPPPPPAALKVTTPPPLSPTAPAAPPVSIERVTTSVRPLPPPPLVRPAAPRPLAPGPLGPGQNKSWPPAPKPPAPVVAPPLPAAPPPTAPSPAPGEVESAPMAAIGEPIPVVPIDTSPAAPSTEPVEPEKSSVASKLREFIRSRATEDTAAEARAVDAEGEIPLARSAPAIEMDPPRGEMVRPLAPRALRTKRDRAPLYVLGGLLVVLLAAIAGLAYKLKQNPEDFAKGRPTPTAQEPTETAPGKIAERVGGGQPAAQPPSNVGANSAPQSAPQSQSSASSQPSVAPSSTAEADVPVAQRAALLVDAPDDPQKVKTYIGTVTWRLDTSADGPPVLKARVDIPEAKTTVSLSITKNTDASVPITHRIDLRFNIAADSPIASVTQIGTPEMRAEDKPQGDPLAAAPVTVTNNYFFIGLAQGDTPAERNLDLLRVRAWFDVPLLLTSGKIAKLTLEKGPTGDRLLDQALDAWSK